MNAPKKMTYATALTNVLNSHPAVDEETLNRLNDLLVQVSKKSRNADGETAKAEENKALAEKVYEQMEANRAYTLPELIKELPMVEEYNAASEKPMNSPKMAYLVNILIDEGRATKDIIKRKNYYTKA